jgi:hypothetical protein
VLPGVAGLTDAAAIRALLGQIRAFKIDWSLIVFDTFSRNMPGADENASEPATAAIAAATQIQRALECIVVLIHHGRKSDGSWRGHSSVPAALDTILGVAKDAETHIVTVTSLKQKDGEDFDKMLYRPRVIDLSAWLPGDDGGPAMRIDTETGEVLEEDDEIVVSAPRASLVLDALDEEDRRQARTERRRMQLRGHVLTAARTLYATFGVGMATSEEWMAAWRTVTPGGTRQAFAWAREALVRRELVKAELREGAIRYGVLGDLARLFGGSDG